MTHITRPLRLAALALVAVGLLGGALAAAGPVGAAAFAPDFTWSLAARTGVATVPMGPDRVRVTRETHEEAFVQARLFTVLLDACRVAGRGPTYVWSGASVTPRRMPGVGPRTPIDERPEGTCLFQTRLPQGKHRLTVRVADGLRQGASVTKEISVRDYLIVSIGDSADSGEGSPDDPQQFDAAGFVRRGPLWKQRPCHRSVHAASARAALQIERDPRTSVTFVHLGCSGAKIGEGLLTKYSGIECCQHDRQSAAFGQLAELKAIVGTRRIDALLISVGVNDIGFSQIGSECMRPDRDCRDLEGAVSTRLDSLFDGTRGSFVDLRDEIAAIGLNVGPGSIHLREYPDITTDADGFHTGFRDNVLQMTQAENVWAGGVVQRLNDKINAAARTFGWDVIDGATTGFRGHGLASGTARWANTPFDSLLVQGPWPSPCIHAQTIGSVLTYGALFRLTGGLYAVGCELVKVAMQATTTGSLHPNPRGYEHLGGLIARRLLGGARIVSYQVAEEAVAGSGVAIAVTMSNTSLLAWEPGEYTLGASGGIARHWGGVDMIPLPHRVEPGDQVTFAFTLTAPAEPGEYHLGWQMRRGGTPFGQGTGLAAVTVKPGDEPVCVTLRRDQARLVSRIRALERELASITTADPDWRQERFRVNAELRGARAALAAVNALIEAQNCP